MTEPRREREVVINEPRGNNTAGIIIALVAVIVVIVLLFVLLGDDGAVEDIPAGGTEDTQEPVGGEEGTTDVDVDVDVDADGDPGGGEDGFGELPGSPAQPDS